MICLNCSHENHPNAKFCEECGQLLARRCPKCGESIRPKAKFCSNCGGKLEMEIPAGTGKESPGDRLATLHSHAPQAQAEIEGERKPVTILFTDIVGSTSLAEKLDPEEWKEIVSGAHQRISHAVYRYEGTIAQLLGDGVLAFFGAPITHEDDPLRSVQAAIDIQEAIQSYASTLPVSVPDFKMRIGIHTGTVVVGSIGDSLHMEYLAVGDAVNLAARLQSAAEPGEILLSAETACYVEHAVLLKDLGKIAVKGKQEPVQTFQVIRLTEIRGHGRRLLKGGKDHLVGRQAEMNVLLNASAAVQAGLGRAVVLTGEPGLGKSRLVSEWLQREGSTLRWVGGECLSYGQGLPYHLVVSWLQSLLEIAYNAPESKTQMALRRLTKDLFGEELGESYAFLAHLLSLKLPKAASRYVQGLNPQGYQVQYLATLRRLLLALAGRQPLALIFEDVHWADPSSVSILSKLLPLTKEAPLLFCIISRPEHSTPGWELVEAARTTMGGGLVEISLQSLAEAEVKELSTYLLEGETLPEAVQKLILERAEGNPLFVEELVSLLIEKDILVREAGYLTTGGDLSTISLPENLVRLMLARIDRLPEEPKRTLRVASVIGRQFLLHTLKDVLKRIGQAETQARLLSQLSELEFTSLIQLAATRPEIGYLFRHALVQEAAYEAVLKSDRRWMHRATAEALESAYPDRLDELAPTLAYHFERGEARQRALYYLERAADRANHTYANAEAIALYRAAIEQADFLVREKQPRADEIKTVELYMKLGDILLRVGQHEAARAEFEEGLTRLSEEQPVWRARLFHRIGNTWMLPRKIGQAIEAYQSAEMVLGGMPEEKGTDAFSLWIDLQLDYVWAYYWMGDVPSMNKIIKRLEPVIELSGTAYQRATYYIRLLTMEQLRDRFWPDDLTLQHGQQAVAAAQESGDLATLGMALFVLGFCHMWRMELDQAIKSMEEGLGMAERIKDMERRVLCSSHLTNSYRRKRDIEAVKKWIGRSLDVAGEAKMPFYLGVAQANQSWVSYMEGDLARAEETARQSQENFPPTFSGKGFFLWPLLAVSLHKDQLEQVVDTAKSIIHPSQIRIPDDLETALRSGIDLYKAGKRGPSKEYFEIAVQMAIEMGYF